MKILFVFITALSLSPQASQVSNSNVHYFYFCDSRAMHHSEVDGKQSVIYTEIMETQTDNEGMKLIASKWSKLVKTKCQNMKGCTSDANFYFTLDEARKNLERLKLRYSDTAKFSPEKIEFAIK